MEIALGSAALVGAGLVWNRITTNAEKETKVNNQVVTYSVQPQQDPSASNERTNMFAKASGAPPLVTQNHHIGSLSGRRDHSNFVDAPSPFEQQMSRLYQPKDGSKREVKAELDPSTKQDNILVRSNTNYQETFFNDLVKPTKMHNVNPIATTTGTASQLVGPGVGIGYDKHTGEHGFHYGQLRMRPVITEPTFREQKGSVIPGKSSIDNRPSEVTLMRHAAANFSIGTSGFEKSDEHNAEPLKFHAISEEYLTSAPGRAVVTGNVGAGGQRLEPIKDFTNRGMENPFTGTAAVGRGFAGVEASDSRALLEGDSSLSTNRGMPGEFVGIATGAVPRSGHQRVIDNFHVPLEQRNSTESHKGSQRLNLSNPGQSAPVMHNNQEMQTTQRQTLQALDVINLGPQVPGAGVGVAGAGDDTRRTARVTNEYRPGPAGIASTPDYGGQSSQHFSYSQGALATKTQREGMQVNEFVGSLKAVGVNAPMSYSDVLASEGYSNELPQVGFTPPAAHAHNTVTAGIGSFDAHPEPFNSNRTAGGGIGNQSSSNFHIVNNNIQSNPNKVEQINQRLDPQILDALSKNDLKL